MHWQFHYPTRIGFYPPDYEYRGLGGSEAVLVLLTRALAELGHHVEVFNCCYRPGVYDGVRWRMTWELPTEHRPDVAVVVGFEEGIWLDTSGAKHHVFWMLNDQTRGVARFHEAFGDMGKVVVASNAMRRRLKQANIHCAVEEIMHPVEVDRYVTSKPRQTAVLFSSMPDRGLDVAFRIWPEIRARKPEAEMWVTSGLKLWGRLNSEAEEAWKRVIATHGLPDGVLIFGAVPRDVLVELQQTAWCNLYPCRFPEMFCVSAAESGAAGTPVICTASEALLERVTHQRSGVLIPGEIEDEVVQAQFIEETSALLEDGARRERLACAAIDEAKVMEPLTVARAWEQIVSRTAA